jgi:hypothetical protein
MSALILATDERTLGAWQGAGILLMIALVMAAVALWPRR